ATSPFEGDGCRPWSGRSTQGCGERGLPSASRARADQVRPPEPINGSGCAETGAACDSEPAALEDQLVPLDTHFEVVQRGDQRVCERREVAGGRGAGHRDG